MKEPVGQPGGGLAMKVCAKARGVVWPAAIGIGGLPAGLEAGRTDVERLMDVAHVMARAALEFAGRGQFLNLETISSILFIFN